MAHCLSATPSIHLIISIDFLFIGNAKKKEKKLIIDHIQPIHYD